MARLSYAMMVLGLLTSSAFAVRSQHELDVINKNSDCDNHCFFTSFPGNSCAGTNPCMCNEQKYREAYFCCMAKNCASGVMSDSIDRQHSDCGARNMDFTFNAEKVCGITLTTSAAAAPTSTAPAKAKATSKAGSKAGSKAKAESKGDAKAQSTSGAAQATSTGSAKSASTGGSKAKATDASSKTSEDKSKTKTGSPSATASSSGAAPEKVMFGGMGLLMAASAMMLL